MKLNGPTGAGCPNASGCCMSDLARYVGPAAADQPPGNGCQSQGCAIVALLCRSDATVPDSCLQTLLAALVPSETQKHLPNISSPRWLLLSYPLSLGKKRGLVFQLHKKLGRPGVMRRGICIAGPLLVAAALLVSASAQSPVSSTSNADEATRPLAL